MANLKGSFVERIKFILNLPKSLSLSYNLLLDKEMPKGKKFFWLGVALAYFLLPLDFLPDFILTPLGYMDDLTAFLFFLDRFISSAPQQVLNKYIRQK